MRPLHAALLMVFAAGALGGCDDRSTAPEKQAANGTGASAEASTPAGNASAATPANIALTSKGAPRRRDGYWEMGSFGQDGSAMSKQYLCVGAGSEDSYSIFDQLTGMGGCDKQDFVRTATGWTFEVHCKLLDTVTDQKGTISGDFQEAFLIDQTVSQGHMTIKGTVQGKRTGECPAKYKAGDLVDDDGSVLVNMAPK